MTKENVDGLCAMDCLVGYVDPLGYVGHQLGPINVESNCQWRSSEKVFQNGRRYQGSSAEHLKGKYVHFKQSSFFQLSHNTRPTYILSITYPPPHTPYWRHLFICNIKGSMLITHSLFDITKIRIWITGLYMQSFHNNVGHLFISISKTKHSPCLVVKLG